MMKFGTETGSLVNHLYSNGQTIPQVGMGCTILRWSDRNAGTIVEVSASGKTIKVQQDKATRIDKNGMSEQQDYIFEPNPWAYVDTYRMTKRGWRNKGCSGLSVGHRSEYYDFSF